jgi:hypothetical protein
MPRVPLVVGLLLLAVPALAADPDHAYVTEGGHLICTSIQTLREAQHAIEIRDKWALDQVKECKLSQPGLKADKLVDGALTAKFRVYDDTGKWTEYWTSPTTMKEVRR